MDAINLTLTREEAKTLFEALVQQPYFRVAALVKKLGTAMSVQPEKAAPKKEP